MDMAVIGLVGAMGSGKSTVADILVSHYGYTRVKMTDVMKRMIRAMGLTDDHIEGHLKDEPCDLLGGRTPRWAMQTLGTQWGRKLIHTDIWIKAAEFQCRKLLADGKNIVIDDARYHNEFSMVRRLNGSLYRVLRAGYDSHPDAHESERSWNTCEVDGIICNTRDISGLYNQVGQLFQFTIEGSPNVQ